MIQTHLMKLEPPYPVLNIDGTIVRHVATLIEVREAYDNQTGEDRIKTVSHPVVDYGDNEYAGIVFEHKDLEACEVLPKVLPQIEFHSMVHAALPMFKKPDRFPKTPDQIVKELNRYGITVEWPMKKDADGFDTDEPEDKIVVPISLGYSEKVKWWAESSMFHFCFDANQFKTDRDLLAYFREMRSSYYKAFADRKFDILFHTNMSDMQYLIDDLNANPHL